LVSRLSSDMRHHDLESKPASAIIAAQVFHTACFAGTTAEFGALFGATSFGTR
jgi:hypothetical protein